MQTHENSTPSKTLKAPPVGNEYRVAIVQHGDYAAALQTFTHDEPETYAGMKASVKAIEELIDGHKFRLLSLDAPAYRYAHRNGTLLSLPWPRFPAFVPRRIPDAIRRAQVMKELRSFAPTHLLLRTTGKLALEVLQYCEKHSIDTLVMFANVFDPAQRNSPDIRELVRLLNRFFVNRVCNHRQPSVDTMVESGVARDKVVAYDFESTVAQHVSAPKLLRQENGCHIVFAASLIETKGCQDIIAAIRILVERGIPAKLSVYGDGPCRRDFERSSAGMPDGTINCLGRQPTEQLIEEMVQCNFVCVPTHREFPEGSNLTITHALCTRTPVIATTHPVFVRSYRDGEGLVFVDEKNPIEIANAIEGLWNNPEHYKALSTSTLAALKRVECSTLFEDVLKDWIQRH